MGPSMDQVLLVGLPVLVLLVVLWAVATALKPRDHGLSDAERYQRELAARSAGHQAAQAPAALGAGGGIEATLRPSQNTQQQHQQDSHAPPTMRPGQPLNPA